MTLEQAKAKSKRWLDGLDYMLSPATPESKRATLMGVWQETGEVMNAAVRALSDHDKNLMADWIEQQMADIDRKYGIGVSDGV